MASSDPSFRSLLRPNGSCPPQLATSSSDSEPNTSYSLHPELRSILGNIFKRKRNEDQDYELGPRKHPRLDQVENQPTTSRRPNQYMPITGSGQAGLGLVSRSLRYELDVSREAAFFGKQEFAILENPEAWLNDTILNYVLAHKHSQLLEADRKLFHVVSSFWGPDRLKEIEDGTAAEYAVPHGVKYIVTPYNLRNKHWVLAVFCVRERRSLFVFDSMSRPLSEPCFVHPELRKLAKSLDIQSKQCRIMRPFRQRDENNCGVATVASMDKVFKFYSGFEKWARTPMAFDPISIRKNILRLARSERTARRKKRSVTTQQEQPRVEFEALRQRITSKCYMQQKQEQSERKRRSRAPTPPGLMLLSSYQPSYADTSTEDDLDETPVITPSPGEDLSILASKILNSIQPTGSRNGDSGEAAERGETTSDICTGSPIGNDEDFMPPDEDPWVDASTDPDFNSEMSWPRRHDKLLIEQDQVLSNRVSDELYEEQDETPLGTQTPPRSEDSALHKSRRRSSRPQQEFPTRDVATSSAPATSTQESSTSHVLPPGASPDMLPGPLISPCCSDAGAGADVSSPIPQLYEDTTAGLSSVDPLPRPESQAWVLAQKDLGYTLARYHTHVSRINGVLKNKTNIILHAKTAYDEADGRLDVLLRGQKHYPGGELKLVGEEVKEKRRCLREISEWYNELETAKQSAEELKRESMDGLREAERKMRELAEVNKMGPFIYRPEPVRQGG